ncbi:MAG: hypothetical protein Q9214_002529, partial [Letrouitia sp. 1 TL-2023]
MATSNPGAREISEDTVVTTESQHIGISSQGLPGKFGSTIFTITVGPSHVTLSAHEGVLSHSPVFDRMCKAGLKETGTRHMGLPEDDPVAISIILEYLYTGQLGNYSTPKYAGELSKAINQLSETYIAAEKYQILDLKSLAVEKLELIVDVEHGLKDFLPGASKVYANIPDSDTKYPSFFQKKLSDAFPMLFGTENGKLLNEYIAEGGKLATDIYQCITRGVVTRGWILYSQDQSTIDGHKAEVRRHRKEIQRLRGENSWLEVRVDTRMDMVQQRDMAVKRLLEANNLLKAELEELESLMITAKHVLSETQTLIRRLPANNNLQGRNC